MSASGTRHVGRVTDPLVRDDGETEPELELEASVSSGERASGPSPSPGSLAEGGEIEAESPPVEDDLPPSDPALDGVHPVRARLLARAAVARVKTPRVIADDGPSHGRLEDVGQASRDRLGDLDALGAPLGGPPSAPVAGGRFPLGPARRCRRT